MLRRFLMALCALLALGGLNSGPVTPGASAAGDCQTFSETGMTVCGTFLHYWQEHGGLAQQGLPITSEMTTSGIDDTQMRTRQFFERAIFEYHEEFAGTPNEVLLTRLGAVRFDEAYQGQQPSAVPIDPMANCAAFPETGQSACGIFLDYWNSHGALAQQGYPLTNSFTERSKVDGKPYIVQYFERAVFEYHPEYAGTPNAVLLSQVGRDYCYAHFKASCFGYGGVGLPSPAPTPTPTPAGPKGAVPLTLSGTGSKTLSVTLPGGLLFASGTNTGRSNFIAELKDQQANYVALLVNEIAPISGSIRAVRVPTTGGYIVSVTATGPWTITLLAPRDVERSQAVNLPQMFSGPRTTVTQFFYAHEGALFVRGSQVGRSNFIADVIDSDGNHIGLAANEIGKMPSDRLVRIPRDGIYLITVLADGAWNLSVQQ